MAPTEKFAPMLATLASSSVGAYAPHRRELKPILGKRHKIGLILSVSTVSYNVRRCHMTQKSFFVFMPCKLGLQDQIYFFAVHKKGEKRSLMKAVHCS
jgi:hypothetical protein